MGKMNEPVFDDIYEEEFERWIDYWFIDKRSYGQGLIDEERREFERLIKRDPKFHQRFNEYHRRKSVYIHIKDYTCEVCNKKMTFPYYYTGHQSTKLHKENLNKK